LTSKSRLQRSKARIRVGKVFSKWSEVRISVLQSLLDEGIQTCELELEDCTHGMFLTLAHSKKRRFIKSEEELAEVIVACSGCHDKIEAFSKEKMYATVLKTIASRRS
jgi:hypothetical protein